MRARGNAAGGEPGIIGYHGTLLTPVFGTGTLSSSERFPVRGKTLTGRDMDLAAHVRPLVAERDAQRRELLGDLQLQRGERAWLAL